MTTPGRAVLLGVWIVWGSCLHAAWASGLPADLNGDGLVDQGDVQIVVQDLGLRDPNVIPVRACALLDQPGKTYVVMEDLSDGLEIGADNLVLDLNGHLLTCGPGSKGGVVIRGRRDVTVRNGRIATGCQGLVVADSNGVFLADLTIEACPREAILVSNSSYLRFQRVTCNRNGEGIVMAGVQTATWEACEASENTFQGIMVQECTGLSVSGLIIRANQIDGIDLGYCSDVLLDGLQVLDNGDDGIDLQAVTRALISNSFMRNMGPNLETEDRCDVVVRDCQYPSILGSENPIGLNWIRRYSTMRMTVMDADHVPIRDAQVSVFDQIQSPGSGLAPSFAWKTDVHGHVPAMDLLWYTNMGGSAVTYAGPYRILVNHPNYQAVTLLRDAMEPLVETVVLGPR